MSLPIGFAAVLNRGVLRSCDGRVVVGGSPLTAMQLSQRGTTLLAAGTVIVDDSRSEHLVRRLLATNLARPVLDGVQPVEADQITVVVPVRDRVDETSRLLADLAPLRVVVVDDASYRQDDIAVVADAHGADLVALTDNVGPASARNAGLARVRTPFVAFVDSDVEVSASMLLRLTRHFIDPRGRTRRPAHRRDAWPALVRAV